jgi:hypothetical protein
VANALYDLGREGFLDGSIDWDTDSIKIALLSAGYTPNLATHKFVSDLGANIVARSAALGSKTVTAGVADAADITFSGVTGAAVTRYAIYKDTGTDTTSRLIALIDTATGLPVTPNGGDITITFDNGSNRIFKL